MRRGAVLIPASVVAGCLGALARILDYGERLGLGLHAIEYVGYVYVALLVGAPLFLYPLARRSGAPALVSISVSLVPAALWWSTEVVVRLRWHTFPEALWLAASPLNLAHLYLLGAALALADAGCRLTDRRSESLARRSRRSALLIGCALMLGPLLVVGSIWPYLQGYHLFFQSGVLPMPKSLPGPLPPAASPAPMSEGRPNLVVILSDDHRYDMAGFAGHPFVETPSLDRLASESVSFTRSYVTTSLCSPSRASLLTGTSPHRHGVWNNFTPWSNDNRTFLEYLGRAGYATAFVGKWHMRGDLPELRGVDHFVTFTKFGGQGVYEWCPLVVNGREEPSRTRYLATELTDRALEWLDGLLRNADKGRPRAPFALVLSHKSVHAGFTPDEIDQGRYSSAPVLLPIGTHLWSHLTNAQYVNLMWTPLPDAIRRYAEAVHSMDREIGRVLDFLDANELRDNTLVVYTSDNGYLWGDRGLVDKRWPYEASIRVPLLLRYPPAAHPGGDLSQALVANLDVAPTLLDFAGLVAPGAMQGRSLRPFLADPSATGRSELLYEYYFEPPYPVPTSHSLITPRLKWIEFEGRTAELYDLLVDPGEQHPLDPNSTEARSLAERLHQQMEIARTPHDPASLRGGLERHR